MQSAAIKHIAAGKPDLGGNELAYLMQVIRDGRITQGKWVEDFERGIAAYSDTKYAVATTSGTTALHLALRAADVGPGDRVIVPALTFVATANAVDYCGAVPDIVDVDANTWCIDIDQVERAIWASKTKAIIAVHLYGVPASMNELRHIADEHGVALIEDAAEALGAWSGMDRVGSIGDMGCFSFYGNKTITTGEGGMVVTNDPKLAHRLRFLRGQAQSERRYWHEEIGFNYRMTELQAAVGSAQLERISEFREARARVMYRYELRLGDVLQFQKISPGDDHGLWAAAAMLPRDVNRDAVIAILGERGIETRPVFYPLNTLPMYQRVGCPVAANIARRGIVLPTYPALTNEDVDYVCDKLLEVLDGR